MSAVPITSDGPEKYPVDDRAVHCDPAVEAQTLEAVSITGRSTRADMYEDDDFADIPMRMTP